MVPSRQGKKKNGFFVTRPKTFLGRQRGTTLVFVRTEHGVWGARKVEKGGKPEENSHVENAKALMAYSFQVNPHPARERSTGGKGGQKNQKESYATKEEIADLARSHWGGGGKKFQKKSSLGEWRAEVKPEAARVG